MSALEDRIAALEERLDQLALPTDSLQASYLTVNPDGTVTATFTGHVAAQGIELPEASSISVTVDSSVAWQDSGGTIHQFIQGFLDSQLGHTIVLDGDSLVIVANGSEYALLDNSGRSRFMQLPSGTARTQFLFGALGSGSTVVTGTSSGGFAVAKTAVGQYKITWAQPFTDAGYGFVAMAGGAYGDVQFGSQAAGSVIVELRSFATDALVDTAWRFIAAGVY